MENFTRVAITEDVFESIFCAFQDLEVLNFNNEPVCNNSGDRMVECLYGYEFFETPFVGVKTILNDEFMVVRREYWLCLPLPRD